MSQEFSDSDGTIEEIMKQVIRQQAKGMKVGFVWYFSY